jgi:hypothetical protein
MLYYLKDVVGSLMVTRCFGSHSTLLFHPSTVPQFKSIFNFHIQGLPLSLFRPTYHTGVILHNNQFVCSSSQSVNHMCVVLYN